MIARMLTALLGDVAVFPTLVRIVCGGFRLREAAAASQMIDANFQHAAKLRIWVFQVN